MKRAAMTFVLAVLFSLATMFTAGDACYHVPSMTWGDACLKSCNMTERLQRLCQETLKSAPDTAEVTVFALIATRLAKLKYEDTMAEIDQVLAAGKLPADQKAAVDHCKEKYGEARSLMVSVADQMFSCDFTRARQEYLDAQVAIGSCKNGLWSYHGLPLLAMVSGDFDLTMVSYELGALIVGR